MRTEKQKLMTHKNYDIAIIESLGREINQGNPDFYALFSTQERIVGYREGVRPVNLTPPLFTSQAIAYPDTPRQNMSVHSCGNKSR